MKAIGHPGYDDDSQYPDDDGIRGEPWCYNFVGHAELHEFCTHHQTAWCRKCDGNQCPRCVDDPHCNSCGAALWEEDHDWDCLRAGKDDEP